MRDERRRSGMQDAPRVDDGRMAMGLPGPGVLASLTGGQQVTLGAILNQLTP